jgi:predicted ATPase/DNA-binding CsgD family transcriptional regulator
VPVPSTSFVGRDAAVVELRGLAADGPLVTLVGPSGSGKTRLAAEVARAEAVRGRRAVSFVELAPVADPGLVAHAVGLVLGVRQRAEVSTEDAVVDALRASAPRLLVLDSCEHVLDATRGLAGRVASACPAVRVLATSRTRLGAGAERAWAVPPLVLPAAMELFVARARAVAAHAGAGAGRGPVGDGRRRAIAEVCWSLDGLPLAIELAAAWTRVLSLPEIAERLDRALLRPSSGAAEQDPRHGTARATVEWSYRLLAPADRDLFRQLSVFAGGFDLEAAEAVVAPGVDVLGGLVRLVDQSLVLTDPRPGGPMRYRVLEPVRQHGLQALREGRGPHDGDPADGVPAGCEPAGGEDAVRRRHAQHFRSLARRCEPFGVGGESPRVPFVRAVEDEPNLLAAAQWARTRPGDLGLRVCVALAAVFELRGPLVDGRAWLEAALARGTEDPALHLQALWSAGKLAWRQGDQDGARALLERGAAAAVESGDAWWVAHMEARLALVALSAGDAAEAIARCDRAVATFQTRRDRVGLLWSLTVRGWARYMERDVGGGDDDMRAALRVDRRVGNHAAAAQGHLGMAYGAFLAGDTAVQRARLVDARAAMSRAGGCVEESGWLACAGALAAREGRLHAALRVTGGARAFGRRAGSRCPARLADPIDELVRQVVGAVGRPVAEGLFAEGETATLDELVADALGGPAGDEARRLSSRERQIAQLVGHGLTNVAIAERLSISRRTVESHVEHVKQKLGVATRQQVMAWALLELS